MKLLTPTSFYKWNDMAVNEYHYPPMKVCQENQDGHRIVINLGEALSVRWKERNTWKQKVYPHGAIGVVPYGYRNEVSWEKQLDILVISLSKNFTDELLGVANPTYSEKRGVTDNSIYKISLDLQREMKNSYYISNLYGDLLAIELALHLGINYLDVPKLNFAPKGKLSSQQLRNSIDYIQTYLDQNISLKELADQNYMSPFHFSRLFKNTIGAPPHQLANLLKVERAKQMIKNKDFKLTEIAYTLGYTDDAHFINLFKKTTGYTPGQFRAVTQD